MRPDVSISVGLTAALAYVRFVSVSIASVPGTVSGFEAVTLGHAVKARSPRYSYPLVNA
jgi:hypothetical protein